GLVRDTTHDLRWLAVYSVCHGYLGNYEWMETRDGPTMRACNRPKPKPCSGRQKKSVRRSQAARTSATICCAASSGDWNSNPTWQTTRRATGRTRHPVRCTEMVSGGATGVRVSAGSGRQGCWAAGSARVCLGVPTTKPFREGPTMDNINFTFSFTERAHKATN